MPKTLATATPTATVDRLPHHAHLCQTSGESVGLPQALAGKGGEATGLTDPEHVKWPPASSPVGRHRPGLLAVPVQVPLP